MSQSLTTSTWVEFLYREFEGVPRELVISSDGEPLLLLSRERERDHYQLFQLAPGADVAGSWTDLADGAAVNLGAVPITQVAFDASRRRLLDTRSLGAPVASLLPRLTLLPEEDPVDSLFNAAMEARDRNDLPTAQQLLHEALDRALPTNTLAISGIHAQLGHFHHSLLGDQPAAARHFAKALEARPRNELASLGLFHSLWAAGSRERALEECVRFVAHRDCDDYQDMLPEILSSDHSPRCNELAIVALELIAARARDRSR